MPLFSSTNFQDLSTYNTNFNDIQIPPSVPSIPPSVPAIPPSVPPIPPINIPGTGTGTRPRPRPRPQQNPIQNPADNYLNNIKTLEEKIPSILDDFKKYYVFFNKNPDYDEYKRIFENLKSNLNEIENDIFQLSNNVNLNIADTSKNLLEYNKLIKKEKTKNDRLTSMFSQYDNKYNGSKELINNYKEIYNINYLRNVFMFVGIIISVIVLLKIFTKNKKE